MTTVRNDSCSFGDAFYVNASDSYDGTRMERRNSSEYFTALSHVESSLADDSGMSCTPPGCFLESKVDTNLLEETLDGELREEKTINTPNCKNDNRNGSCDSKSEKLSNSFFIVSSSHERLKSSSSSQYDMLSGRSSRCSTNSHSTFTFDGNISADEFFEQPSMEYDDAFTPFAQSSPPKDQQREKIYIRELSFDELQDLKGVDLMAPVFLAVTNEDVDEFHDLQRKCKSIEDLCSTISFPELDDSFLRKRSKSALNLRRQKNEKKKKPSPLCLDEKEMEADSCSLNEAKQRLASLNTSLKSHISFEDVRFPSSPGSSVYDTSREFEIPNSEEYLPSPSAFSLSDEEFDEKLTDEQRKQLNFKFSLNTQELIRTPERVEGSTCGFWEYPYGSPISPPPSSISKTFEMMKSPSLNTSPKSPTTTQSSSDRFVVVSVAGQQRIVDMKLIEDYLQILTHGGHHVVGKERRVIVVFNAYYLPKRNIPKYNIIIEQLFYYCVHAVDLMVMDSYEIVFFNSAMDGTNMPPRQMIRQCYDMVQYRLKKNLQKMFFVHPSLLLKTVLRFTNFFVSSKFRRKVHLVKNIKTLKNHLPLEYIFISQEIKKLEQKFT